jgi:hypothetical protein
MRLARVIRVYQGLAFGVSPGVPGVRRDLEYLRLSLNFNDQSINPTEKVVKTYSRTNPLSLDFLYCRYTHGVRRSARAADQPVGAGLTSRVI